MSGAVGLPSGVECSCGRMKRYFKSHHSQAPSLYLCPSCDGDVVADVTGGGR